MICTFYSYKGGVGRSMALANVGEWLYLKRRMRVVMVDWDLEAPGLEAYFPSDETNPAARPGLVDLLLDYKADLPHLDLPPEGEEFVDATIEALTEQLPPLRTRLVPVRPPLDGADHASALWLLPAGRRDGDGFAAYARAVQRFDWNEFYDRYRGQVFFEWLRRQLLADDVADVALIDTRTGISEMGGVGTRQLADIIISFCAPNEQNIEGVLTLSKSFQRADVMQARGRPLQQLVVPTRIENSEIDARNLARYAFKDRMADLIPEAMAERGLSFWDLRIPYVPKYAYTERLAVGASDAAEELETAYGQLADQLLALAPEGGTVHARFEEEWRHQTRDTRIAVSRESNLPARLPLLLGREKLLTDLRSQLVPAATPIVLYGIGGVGKSALAIEFGHRFTADYQVMWWIDASTSDSIDAGYAGLAEKLGVANGGDPVAAARDWLASNEGWLLVLDGAEVSEDFGRHMPRDRRGHVLLTSLNPRWSTLATGFEVPVLAREDAIDLVRRRTGEVDLATISELASALGDHPLALEEACAYVDATGRSLASFLRLYERQGAALLAQGNEVLGSAQLSLGARWERAYRQLPPDSLAHDLLALSSVMARVEIPLELLGRGSRIASAAFLWDAMAVDRASAELRRFSFATVRRGGFWVNPVLRSFVRRWLRALLPMWVDIASTVVSSALAEDLERSECEQLLEHAVVLLRRGTSGSVSVLDLAARASRSFEALGRIEDAVQVLDRAVVAAQRSQPQRADGLMRDRLALLLQAGDLAAAEKALTQDFDWAFDSAAWSKGRIAGDLAVIQLRRDKLELAERTASDALRFADHSQRARAVVNLQAVVEQRTHQPQSIESLARSGFPHFDEELLTAARRIGSACDTTRGLLSDEIPAGL